MWLVPLDDAIDSGKSARPVCLSRSIVRLIGVAGDDDWNCIICEACRWIVDVWLDFCGGFSGWNGESVVFTADAGCAGA